jgi:tRNA-2-methylthio-N6-dimethylallyladenosine synthase
LFEKTGKLPGQLVGKSDHLHAVYADAPEHLIGEVAKVRIIESATHSLGGVLV